MNFKVIGIHKGYNDKKNYNIGIFIKPAIDEFYKNKGKERKEDEDMDKENTGMLTLELKLPEINNIENLSKNNKKILSLIALISFIYTTVINIFIKFIFNKNNSDLAYHLSSLLFFVIIIEILICIMKCFLNCWINLILSFILEMPLLYLFFLDIKKEKEEINIFLLPLIISIILLMKSSLWGIIVHFEFEIINALILGEISSNFIFSIFLYITKNLLIEIFIFIFCLVILLTTIGALILFKIKYEFLTNTVKDGEKEINDLNDELKEKYAIENCNNFINVMSILLNVTLSFSLSPILLFYYKAQYLNLILFIIFDACGKFISKSKKITSNIFRIIIFFKIVFLITVLFINKYQLLIKFFIFLIGIMSGLSTGYSYSLPMKEEEKLLKKYLLCYMGQLKSIVICTILMILLFIICI